MFLIGLIGEGIKTIDILVCVGFSAIGKRKIVYARKRPVYNVFNSVGKLDLRQFFAARKRVFFYRGNIFGNVYAFEIYTALEYILIYFCYSGRNFNAFKALTA